MPPGPTALRQLTRINVLLTWKWVKKVNSLSRSLPHTSPIGAVELRLDFVTVLSFCQFDCLTEGITTLFVLIHVPRHLAVNVVVFAFSFA
jgi:hypothetical protein